MHQDFISSAISALPKKAPAGTKKFLKSLSDKINEEDLGYLDPITLANICASHVRLREDREQGAAAIDVYTPSLDQGEWGIPRTIIDIVTDDMSFIVDSVAATINRSGYLIYFLFHPVVDGVSHVHVQLQGPVSPDQAEELHAKITQTMEDVRLANSDWEAMRKLISSVKEGLGEKNPAITELEREEGKQFIEYLLDGNFTFLGATVFDFDPKTNMAVETGNAGLGLLGSGRRVPFLDPSCDGLPEERPDAGSRPIAISKTRSLSSVHRNVPLDIIKFREYAEGGTGTVCRESVFIGLYTSGVYSRSVERIPLIRCKIADVIEESGFEPGSHNRRALRHILEKYPRDELFQIDKNRLKQITQGILGLQERQRIALYTREDKLGRFVSCLIYVPRERYDTSLRLRLQGILEEEIGGRVNAYYATLDDSVFARLLVIIGTGDKNRPAIDEGELEKKLQAAGRTWSENLRDALSNSIDNREMASKLYARYANAFSRSYSERYQPFQGVCDIGKIEEALRDGSISLDLYRSQEEDPEHLRLKIYQPGSDFYLSDVLPLLESMGLRAISDMPFEIRAEEAGQHVWMHDFLLELPEMAGQFRLKEIKDHFEEALKRIWYGEAENDGINKLVVTAGMGWREIMILRAYVRYMRQMRLPYSVAFMERTLAGNPTISRMLVDMFVALFDPAGNAGSEKSEIEEAGYGVAIDHELEKVVSLDQDRVLRILFNLIESTVRTNYFQTDEDGSIKPYLSIKLNSRKIAELPEPRPFMEIFVYSPGVEGVHLRGDMIARGGLRWSDREEDFRTEILGLMKAQMVKNAIIVPVGAKGGFIVKRPPKEGGREALKAEGIECYKTFIRGLLDITDNRTGEKIVPPKDVVRRDGDDPYLVVAADKGTATFSDIANTISHQYGFWMGDAFASGGSTGYDHKAMGITARGAWESVRRHFRNMGKDIQKEDFEVIGVGDMSGDVFGNGMLLSKHIKLIGAFNHLHIFCDPDPDPEAAYRERLRLFGETSGWDGYDNSVLSPGGRIFSRAEKSLQLTPEIRKRFRIEREKVTPAELIRAMLKARGDLLWFGGIGTYVKASHESHADVGDKSNDALRINAAELNVRVIGEVANLAITQLGRVEFALSGGKINTDFIDNSGGVNTSDHEVNIKILFSGIMDDKNNRLSLASRNNMLEKMADEVAADVLDDNYQQAISLSLAESLSADQIALQAEFIRDLERELGIRRKLEGLPEEKEIQDRIASGKGLTSPELAVLMAYAKITFTKDLLASDIPDNKDMEGWLFEYFPANLRERFPEEIRGHRLRREIIATRMANDLVNHMGPVFVKSLMIRNGAPCSEVAKAYLTVLESFRLPQMWKEVEALDGQIALKTQLQMLTEISELVRSAINWLLMSPDGIDISRDIPLYREGISCLTDNIGELVTKDLHDRIAKRRKRAVEEGITEALAEKISVVPVLNSGLEIVRLASENSTGFQRLAAIYFEVGSRFGFEWLREQARRMRHDSRWTIDALGGIVDKFYGCQSGLSVKIVNESTLQESGKEALASWLQKNEIKVAQYDTLLEDMRGSGSIDLPMLIVAEQRLRLLISHSGSQQERI